MRTATPNSRLRCASIALLLAPAFAWVNTAPSQPSSLAFQSSHQHQQPNTRSTALSVSSEQEIAGNLHGQNSCFLPLMQLDQDWYMPRIVQICGAYPGLTVQEFRAVTSEPSPPEGQWTYDFSDPDGPQLGTVALEGSNLVASCEDPVVIIAEHFSLGIELPDAVKDPVDTLVLVDRAKARFGERKFLVLDVPGEGLRIGAFNTKEELPAGSEILGQVEQVTIPWLPCMKPTKTGFLEADEYF